MINTFQGVKTKTKIRCAIQDSFYPLPHTKLSGLQPMMKKRHPLDGSASSFRFLLAMRAVSQPRRHFRPFFLPVRFHLSIAPTSAHDTLRFSDTDSSSTTKSTRRSPHTILRSKSTTARRSDSRYESHISLFPQFCIHWPSPKEF